MSTRVLKVKPRDVNYRAIQPNHDSLEDLWSFMPENTVSEIRVLWGNGETKPRISVEFYEGHTLILNPGSYLVHSEKYGFKGYQEQAFHDDFKEVVA